MTPTRQGRRGRPATALAAAFLVMAAPAAVAEQPMLAANYTDEQADRGEYYFLTNCATCHGFEQFDSFLDYPDASAYLSRIALTMPYENEGGLPRQWYVDIVAYIMRGVGYPAGEQDLPDDSDVLSQIIPAEAASD